MKNLIGALLLPLVIFSKFSGLDASSNTGGNSGNPGSSSGSWKKSKGGRKKEMPITPPRLPILTRAPDMTVEYRFKTVHLWTRNQVLEQANWPGMRTNDYEAMKTFGLLIGVDVVGGYPTVIYMFQNGTLLAVRAPRYVGDDFLEPTFTDWYIIDGRRYFHLSVEPTSNTPPQQDPWSPYRYIPIAITFQPKNERELRKTDIVEKFVYPLGMTFCLYKRHLTQTYADVIGAFFPTDKINKNNALLSC